MALIRTLIVDDSADFIRIARRYLEREPRIELVAPAMTGEDAVQQALETQPDLILLDLILPDINGVEVTRQVKALLPQATIVLFTLYDLDEYRAEALQAGADAFLSKTELSEAWVNSLVETMSAKAKKTSILVVDDSPTIRRMVMAALRPLGAELGEASTGLEAIEQLALKVYDAMTLDLNMPDMHGLEVLEFLRSSERYRGLPVIILSTRGDDESRVRALADGANLYLTKPFRPDELVSAVKGLLAA